MHREMPRMIFDERTEMEGNPVMCWWHIHQCQGCGRTGLSYTTMWTVSMGGYQDCRTEACSKTFPRVVAAGVVLKAEFRGAEK